MTTIFHIALADDWEASVGQGEYEAATRGVLYEPGGHIRATTASGVRAVLEGRYRDVRLPLLLVRLDAEALDAAGSSVEFGPDDVVRIRGTIPSGDPDVVRGTDELVRDADGWRLPQL